MTFKNKHYTHRNYELTNVIACIGDTKPNDNWVNCDDDILNNLTHLYTENDIKFYGYL